MKKINLFLPEILCFSFLMVMGLLLLSGCRPYGKPIDLGLVNASDDHLNLDDVPVTEWEYFSFQAGPHEVGRLSWDEGQMNFKGSATPSARAFFEKHLKPVVDRYIRARCEGRM